jgi:hypothetical protein
MPRKVPEYLVDDAAIVATHDGMIIQDHDLSTHVALINASHEIRTDASMAGSGGERISRKLAVRAAKLR